jgi:hypothetical protein
MVGVISDAFHIAAVSCGSVAEIGDRRISSPSGGP